MSRILRSGSRRVLVGRRSGEPSRPARRIRWLPFTPGPKPPPGSRSPASEPPEWLVQAAAETAKDARTSYLAYITFVGYIGFTVATITDRAMFLNESIDLPVIGVSLPALLFVGVAPAVALALFINAQGYLARLARLQDRLRTATPRVDEDRIPGWAPGFQRRAPGWRGAWYGVATALVIWLPLPSVLWVLSRKVLRTHRLELIYVTIGVAALVSLISVFYWHRADGAEPPLRVSGRWFRRVWRRVRKHPGKLALLVAVLFFYLRLAWMAPGMADGGGYLQWERGRAPFDYDLGHQVLVTRREDDFPGLWADFSDAHLEGANLESSLLKRANLDRARLQKALARDASFEGARLRQARLDSAMLARTNLRAANLYWASLRGAALKCADMRGADVELVDFTGAFLTNVDLTAAKHVDVEALVKAGSLHGILLDSAVLRRLRDAHPELVDSLRAHSGVAVVTAESRRRDCEI